MAYFWSLSLNLTLIFFTSSVLSHYCHNDGECDGVKVCCGKGMCTYSWLCVWCKDDSDCYGGKKCSLHLGDNRSLCVNPPVTAGLLPSRFTRVNPSTMPKKHGHDHGHDENCSADEDCPSSQACWDGKCVYSERDKKTGNHSPLPLAAWVIIIVVLAKIVLLSLCFYKRLKRTSHVSQTEISRNARPASNTNHETNAALQTGNMFVDMPMEEISPPIPADEPPPYSSLKFERKGNRCDEGEHEAMRQGNVAFDVVVVRDAVSPLPCDAPPPYNSLEY